MGTRTWGYLERPQVLQVVADDDLFVLARPCGFDRYIDMVYLPDVNNLLVYIPLHKFANQRDYFS